MDDHALFDPVIGEVEKIIPGVRRILAPNPSPMTFKGTNTYLVGKREIAVIDPGPPDESHMNAILDAIEGHQRISHVVVTHSHADHSPLAMVLAQFSGAKVYGFGPSTAGRARVMEGLVDIGGGEGIDETFMPDVTLRHLDEISGTSWTLRALHTPGHMGNHLCFELDFEDRFSGHVFTGDTVMGWASSMVSPPDGHLTDFMNSLHMLRERPGHQTYHPGHGATIEAPKERVEELLAHRQSRDRQIVSALQKRPGTARSIAEEVYTDVPAELLPAAARNVLAHLIDLTDRGIAAPAGALTETALFRIR